MLLAILVSTIKMSICDAILISGIRDSSTLTGWSSNKEQTESLPDLLHFWYMNSRCDNDSASYKLLVTFHHELTFSPGMVNETLLVPTFFIIALNSRLYSARVSKTVLSWSQHCFTKINQEIQYMYIIYPSSGSTPGTVGPPKHCVWGIGDSARIT